MKNSSTLPFFSDSAATKLFSRVVGIVDAGRDRVRRAVNVDMVTTYWLVGREIVQTLQEGQVRAQYGNAVISDLSARLAQRYGAGFSVANLKNFRQFYLAYRDGASPDSNARLHAPGIFLTESEISYPSGSQSAPRFHPVLSWSHYRALMRINNDAARAFYEAEAAKSNWSRRDLERQIGSFFYERLVVSADKEKMLEGIPLNVALASPLDMLKDPYVLEFLDLPPIAQLQENHIEQAIIDGLQHFLLELGRGFSFVARQKRLRFDHKDFYVDLVFYNYLLKCFVLIDLKIGELTHQDIGQMDGYVRMFEAQGKVDDDNPTIGLILCFEKMRPLPDIRY